MKRRIPALRLRKPTGQAVVRLDGRDVYLGRHGTDASPEKYRRVVAEWLSEALSVLTFRGKLEFDSIRREVAAIAFILGQFRTHVVVGVSASWMTLAILGR